MGMEADMTPKMDTGDPCDNSCWYPACDQPIRKAGLCEKHLKALLAKDPAAQQAVRNYHKSKLRAARPAEDGGAARDRAIREHQQRIERHEEENQMPKPTQGRCRVSGCGKPVKNRGVCATCYFHQIKYDDDRAKAIRAAMLPSQRGRSGGPRADRTPIPAPAAADRPADSPGMDLAVMLLQAVGVDVQVRPFRGGQLVTTDAKAVYVDGMGRVQELVPAETCLPAGRAES